jgi:hypothetical protein
MDGRIPDTVWIILIDEAVSTDSVLFSVHRADVILTDELADPTASAPYTAEFGLKMAALGGLTTSA